MTLVQLPIPDKYEYLREEVKKRLSEKRYLHTLAVAEAAKKQFGYDLDKKKMHLPDAIKNLGTYHITIRLHQKVTAELKVHVSEQ